MHKDLKRILAFVLLHLWCSAFCMAQVVSSAKQISSMDLERVLPDFSSHSRTDRNITGTAELTFLNSSTLVIAYLSKSRSETSESAYLLLHIALLQSQDGSLSNSAS